MKKTIKNYWVTHGEILDQQPCGRWSRANVLKWFKGRKKVRLSTILKDVHIPDDDRCWIVEQVIYMREDIPGDWWAVVARPCPTLDTFIAAVER